jgi:gluconokinase
MGETTGTGAVLFVMGPAGAGKTTVARRLAATLGYDFIEGDAFHTPANIAKMRAGIALDETDRAPWLEALRGALCDAVAAGRSIVVACSGLRRIHRERLLRGLRRVAIVYLDAAPGLLHHRIAGRSDHYMPPDLVASQLDALEPPHALSSGERLTFGPWTDRALFIDAAAPVDRITEAIAERLED